MTRPPRRQHLSHVARRARSGAMLRARVVATPLLALALACKGDAERYGSSDPAVPGDQATLRLGGRVYAQSCASCHGAGGEGAPRWSEPDAQGELPPPPHDSTGHTWRHSDGMLYRIVHEGWKDPFNRTTRLTMPAFGATLTPEEMRAVIAYLKPWWTAEQRRAQRNESVKHPFPHAP